MSDLRASGGEAKRVVVEKEGPLGWLRLDNPLRRNAMSFAMWGDLQRGVEYLADEPDVRVILVTGNDGRTFCAGGDISEFDRLRAGAGSKNSYDAAAKAAMKALREVQKPTIALIHGYCLGGGMGLALQCDLRYAAESARLGIPAAKRGIAYDFAGVQQLVGVVGPAAAKDMLYTARQLSGEDAFAIGLVNGVLPDADIHAAVRATATTIAEHAPLSLRASKMMVDGASRDASGQDLDSYHAAEIACLESEDYREATRAFQEKRQPVFRGR